MIATLRRALAALLALAGMLALAGCVVQSPTNLLAGETLVTPLPASFTLYPYDKEGGYARSDDKPMGFTRERDGTYLTTDKSMRLSFLPLGADTYLMAVGGEEPGVAYGIMRVVGDYVALSILLGNGAEDAVAALKSSASADIAADIAYSTSELAITKRPTLDAVIAAIGSGALPTETLIAFIGPADATPPDSVSYLDGKVLPN